MKKLITLVLIAAIGIGAWNLFFDSDPMDENVYFQVDMAYSQNGKLIICGNIVNGDSENHVLGIENAEVDVTDCRGTLINRLSLKPEVMKNLKLRPQSQYPCRLTITSLAYESSEYEDFNNGIFVELNGKVRTSKCKGIHCSKCGGAGNNIGGSPYERPSNPYDGQNDSLWEEHSPSDIPFTGYSQYEGCVFCNGSHKCSACYGTGLRDCSGGYCLHGKCTACDYGMYDHGSYSSRCTVCGGDGNCNRCNGTGKEPCPICRGTGKCTHCK